MHIRRSFFSSKHLVRLALIKQWTHHSMLFLFNIISKMTWRNYHLYNFFLFLVALGIPKWPLLYNIKYVKLLTVMDVRRTPAIAGQCLSRDQTIYHFLPAPRPRALMMPIFQYVQLNSSFFMFISGNLITFFLLLCGEGDETTDGVVQCSCFQQLATK